MDYGCEVQWHVLLNTQSCVDLGCFRFWLETCRLGEWGDVQWDGRQTKLELLQQLCNWKLLFVGVCQVPKRFAKGKISLSPSVWHFWLGISQNSGPNYFCPGIFHLRGKFSRTSRGRFLFRAQFLRPSRAITSPVAANSLARRSRLAGNYRDVGSTGTTRSPRFLGYQNCQPIVPMQKCQVWFIKCLVWQNA